MTITTEQLAEFVETQLAVWPLSKQNLDQLAKCRRRNFLLGDLPVAVQWNQARIKSTGADISKEAVRDRKCFLCKANRPSEQMGVPLTPDWELLVNPYPVFPLHFTIASRHHVPQTDVPLEMVSFAEMLPGMAVFFNGARAGASAPDHLHLQAVMAGELPLLRLITERHTPDLPGIKSASELGLDLPFHIESGLVAPDVIGMQTIARMMRGNDGLLNMYAFTDPRGYMHIVRAERTSHRPQCYTAPGPERLLVSPGALEMAGVVVTPREEDFEIITESDLRKIYSECAKQSPGA